MSGDRDHAQRRQGRPPDQSFFAGLWKPLGYRSAVLALPGLSVRLDGMDEAWHGAFLQRYGAYARDTTTDRGAFTLTLSASRGGNAYHVEPPASGVAEYTALFVEAEPEPTAAGHYRVRACTYDLAASFSTLGGRGHVIFSKERFDPIDRAVENILRVAIAWLAVSQGGLLMHSASIVKDGRGYLFFGQSGAGKSTLSERSTRGQVVSDDLTLILPDPGGRPEVVGTPFRGTYAGGKPVRGRFPLAAALRLRKAAADEPAAVSELAERRALPDAVANLPFVVDQLGTDPELFERVERVLRSFPIKELRFRKEDDSYWDEIERSGL